VLTAFDGWHESPGWQRDDPGCRRLNALVDRVRLILDDLPADPDLSTAVGAVSPLLNAWWPSGRELALEPLSEAIERLRYLTAWRPSFIHQARMSIGLAPRRPRTDAGLETVYVSWPTSATPPNVCRRSTLAGD
jgi:hypothetical protein